VDEQDQKGIPRESNFVLSRLSYDFFVQFLGLAMRLLPAGSQFNYLPARQSFSARPDEYGQLYFH